MRRTTPKAISTPSTGAAPSHRKPASDSTGIRASIHAGPRAVLSRAKANSWTSKVSAFTARSTPANRRVRSAASGTASRSEEHTSELQSHHDLVCRLLLEKKKKKKK